MNVRIVYLGSCSLAALVACAAEGEAGEALESSNEYSSEQGSLQQYSSAQIMNEYPAYNLNQLRLKPEEYTDQRVAADEEWMQARMERTGVDSIDLDYSQPRDLMYTLRRLHRNGVTPETHPHLYTLIAANIAGDIPRHNSARAEASATSSWCGFNFSNWQTSSTSSGAYLRAQTVTGCSGGAPYVYKDLATAKVNSKGTQYPISTSYVEEFDEGKYVEPPDLKNQLVPNGYNLRSTSQVIVILSDGTMKTTSDAEMVDAACTVVPQHPIDNNLDNQVNVCQNGRTACDYVMNSAAGRMWAPWGGTFTYMVKGESGTIYKSKFSGFSSYVGKIHNAGNGFFCNSVSLPSLSYTVVTSTSSLTKLNIPQFNLDYGAQCYSASTLVYLNADIQAYGSYDANSDGRIDGADPVKYCNQDSYNGNPENVPQSFNWVEGCLRAGTEVVLAEGGAVVIDELYTHRDQVIGRSVVTSDGLSGTIEAVTNGQDSHFIHLEDDSGHVVEVTATHPVITPIGPTPAELLKAGDMIETIDGPARLLLVEEVGVSAQVYNLVVRPASVAPHQATYGTFFAGGVAVGDNNLQLLQAQLQTRLPRPATTENWVKLFQELHLYK